MGRPRAGPRRCGHRSARRSRSCRRRPAQRGVDLGEVLASLLHERVELRAFVGDRRALGVCSSSACCRGSVDDPVEVPVSAASRSSVERRSCSRTSRICTITSGCHAAPTSSGCSGGRRRSSARPGLVLSTRSPTSLTTCSIAPASRFTVSTWCRRTAGAGRAPRTRAG